MEGDGRVSVPLVKFTVSEVAGHFGVSERYLSERESTRETVRDAAETYALRRETEVRKTVEFGPEAVLTFGSATGLYLEAGKPDAYLKPIFSKWQNRLVRDIKPGNVQDLARTLYPNAREFERINEWADSAKNKLRAALAAWRQEQ